MRRNRLPLETWLLVAIVVGAWEAEARAADTNPPAGSLIRLSPTDSLWIDKAHKRVLMVGEICRRDGQMEMFACLKQTKEHESIVAVATKAQMVHAALVAIGAEPGNPATFIPEYKPARGTEIDISIYWTDEQGKRRAARAQDWLKNSRTGKELDQPWVFGGSSFWEDPKTKERFYQAEDGDFICVSNFASAMLDLPIESSDANSALMFEGWAERIPPKGTRVTVALAPRLKGLDPRRGDDPQLDQLPPDVPAADKSPAASDAK